MESKGHQDEQKNDEFMNGQKRGGGGVGIKTFFQKFIRSLQYFLAHIKIKIF